MTRRARSRSADRHLGRKPMLGRTSPLLLRTLTRPFASMTSTTLRSSPSPPPPAKRQRFETDGSKQQPEQQQVPASAEQQEQPVAGPSGARLDYRNKAFLAPMVRSGTCESTIGLLERGRSGADMDELPSCRSACGESGRARTPFLARRNQQSESSLPSHTSSQRLLSLQYGADLVWGPEVVDRAIIGCDRTVDGESRSCADSRVIAGLTCPLPPSPLPCL